MTIILPGSARNAKKKTRPLKPVKASRAVEKEYRESLNQINQTLNTALEPINTLLLAGGTATAIADIINQQFNATSQQVENISIQLAREFVRKSNSVNKERVENVYKRAFSVDSATIIDSPNVQEEFNAAVFENVNLIKSIPARYFSDVTQAITNNFRGIPQIDDQSLRERLLDIGDISESRAQLIARDQTAKLNGQFTRIRHQNAGVKKYIWRTAKDQRVVGNPSGLYPTGSRLHGNHFNREGKVFFYDRPPDDGNPGFPIQCRCFEEPILDLDDLNVIYT